MVITLDGPSGTGKSTLAKLVAKHLGFKFLNSGMIYRAICYFLLAQKILPEDNERIIETLARINIVIKFIENNQNIIINGTDCTPYVNSKDVQENVSLYSQILPIREKVLSVQRNFAKNNNIVVEGRDIGTEVFPNAKYKFYIICDIDVRAKRRYNDLVNQGHNISLNEVVESLKNRDYLDSTRKFSPLKKPNDSIEIDTSNKSISQSLDEIVSAIECI